jgi:replicative DNA helicase
MGQFMPNSIQAEKSVLGMILTSKFAATEATSYLQPRDFFEPKHATIFSAAVKLSERGEVIDITTITNVLSTEGSLDSIGGVNYLMELADSVASSANVSAYIKIITDKATARNLILASNRIKDLVENSSDDISDVVAAVEKEVHTVTRKLSSGTFRDSDDIVESVLKEVKRVEELGGVLPGTITGYEKLDQMTAGFQPGDYIILAARPSMGKTAFALNLLSRSCDNNDGVVAMFSLEMPAEQIVRRLISLNGHIDQSVIRTPHLMNADERSKLLIGADTVSKKKIYIDDTPAIKLNELKARARKLSSEHKVDMIVIDYLSLIALEKSYNNKVIEIGEVSKGLKTLARELNVPVVVLSQLSRQVEQRQDKRPIMSDLRESGAIEQDADLVMFLYRDKYYEPESEKGDLSELLIRKHRNGPTGTIELTFNNRFGQFID